MGAAQFQRYFTSAGFQPYVGSGHGETMRDCPVAIFTRLIWPSKQPSQTMLLSLGSGVAKPLSQPPTWYQSPAVMPPPKPPRPAARLLLGPLKVLPSWRLP